MAQLHALNLNKLARVGLNEALRRTIYTTAIRVCIIEIFIH
jgi:hypothetical protein